LNSSMGPPNTYKERCSANFENIPNDIILYIANYLVYSNIGALGTVSRCFLEIIRLKWPLSFGDFVYWSDSSIEDSLKRDFYQLCMGLYKEKAIFKKNNDVTKNRSYLAAIINDERSPFKEDPSQWNVIVLKCETYDIAFNVIWDVYLGTCVNLVYITLNYTRLSYLDFRNLINLKGLFLGYGATVHLPPSIETFVLYTLGEKYRNPIKNLDFLNLNSLKCTKLKFL
jgi:hypothetical protein